jgi:hypothetical protein
MDYSPIIIVAMETMLEETMKQSGASSAVFPHSSIFIGGKVYDPIFVVSLFFVASSRTHKNHDLIDSFRSRKRGTRKVDVIVGHERG